MLAEPLILATVIRDYDFMVEKLDRTQKAGEEDLFAITTENSLGF